jgi:FkbH-like protein
LKLAEALRIGGQAKSRKDSIRVALACGFTPLHFQTFLTAEIATRIHASPEIAVGLFDDLLGTLCRLEQKELAGVVVALEWSDVDARLGVRGTHGWRLSKRSDLTASVDRRLAAIGSAIDALSIPTVVILPTLPLPPMFGPPGSITSAEALDLRAKLLAFAAARRSARVVDPQRVDECSPFAERLRLSTALQNGFPMTLEHASRLAAIAAEALLPPMPLKGIITDLDDTLWRGILGEEGVDGVHWSIDRHSQNHALYQELLASLAEIGVLIGIVSKNDPTLVEKALNRNDLVLTRENITTVEAGWGPKSEAVERMLRAWNIAPDSVVFVDDSAFERSEVQRQFPDIRCLPFPVNDDDALWELLRELRRLFGKSTVTPEDAIRAESLRAGAVFRAQSAESGEEAILAEAEAVITIEFDRPDARALELVNKTNQFNLNGHRIDESTWHGRASDAGTFFASVTYADKYSPLGKIAVVVGRKGHEPAIDFWVMSCRAFSRRIEHHTLKALFDWLNADMLRLDFSKTPRNGPFEDFLRRYSDTTSIERTTFHARCPALYAKVEIHGRHS